MDREQGLVAGVNARKPAKGRSELKRVALCLVWLLFLLIAFQGCRGASSRREPAVDDKSIVARIHVLISEDSSLSNAAVRAFAQEGRVTLSGTISDSETKARFLERVRHLPGVKSVSDNLELSR
jgi:osmotically-inducible protein OsmY